MGRGGRSASLSQQGMHAKQRVSPQKITLPRRLSHTWQRSPCPGTPGAEPARGGRGISNARLAEKGSQAEPPTGQAVQARPTERPLSPEASWLRKGAATGTLPLLDPHRGPAGFQAGLRGRLPGPAERAAAGASAPGEALPPGERAETPGRLPPRASRWLNYNSHHPSRRG